MAPLNQNQTPSLPPEIPPRLFALPDKQQLVPGALQPQARSDLEGLIRLCNDHIAAAMGVPASVVFEGTQPEHLSHPPRTPIHALGHVHL